MMSFYEAWAEEYPYPTYDIIYILGSKFMDLAHEGRLDKSKIHDLGAILNGKVPGRESDEQIILYSVGGMPVEDVAWGKEIYDYAIANGIGTKLPLWDKPALY
jgi:ornithine cyclodeaminase